MRGPSSDALKSVALMRHLRPVRRPRKKAAAPLGVVLHDHIIIGRNGHTSLRDLGLI
jgi:DNA repair protein RadC